MTLSINAVSYLFSAAGLSSTAARAAPQLPEVRVPLRRQIAEGFHAVYGSPILRSLLTQFAALNVAYGAVWTVFLVYAVRVLGLSPFKLGITVGAMAVGALLAALSSHRFRDVLGYGQAMVYATIGLSTALLLLLIPRNAGLLSMAILMVAVFCYGASITTFNVNAITLRQMATPKRLLARMNATYRLLLFGAPPLGGLLGGVLGSAIGLRPALLVAVIALTSPMLWLFTSPVFRIREMPTAPEEDQAPPEARAAEVVTAKEGADD